VLPLIAYIALCSMTLAQPQVKPTLLDLAEKKFAPRALTDAETKLFTNAERGEPAVELTGDDKQDDPANAATWPTARVVHAECLAWLLTNRQASKCVTNRGIWIAGARIDGILNLDDGEISVPLGAWNCAFNGKISLTNAH